MSQCEILIRDASGGVAAALRAVDCMSAEATASAFERLFGTSGSLLSALTLLLTLYIGFFAISLLTGRSRISISALTPLMLTLGLVLTFATSWAAYQGVVWNLATGAPDQIAGVLLGTQGSATQLFAGRIDILFNAIAETAAGANGAQGQPSAQATFAPVNLMWLGALLLMIGTTGLLVTARIALAVLLALGPVFITLALFPGTRGLFAGWLRGVVLTAISPLFAVLGGAFMVELAVPVVASLRGAEGIDGRAAMALFMIGFVHCALMVLAIRVGSAMVAGWRVFNPESRQETLDVRGTAPGGAGASAFARPNQNIPQILSPAANRGLTRMTASSRVMVSHSSPDTGVAIAPARREVAVSASASGAAIRIPRAHGIGSRFARPANSQGSFQ